MKPKFTKEESIASAKAWLDRKNPQNMSEWMECWNLQGVCSSGHSDFPTKPNYLFVKDTNGGGFGGWVIVFPVDDEQGTVIAIEEYTGNTKKFPWRYA